MTVEEQLTVLANDIRQTREACIRIEGTLDKITDKLKDQDDALADHEARLRELEKSRWPIAQISVVIAFLSLIAAVLIPLFFV